MSSTPWVVIVYGCLLLVGGMMGFVKAHSWPSLVMGSLSALLMIIAGAAMFKKSVLAYFVACTVSFCLALFFGYRFYNTYKIFHTFKFMPAGMMGVISLIVFLILIVTKGQK